MIPGNAPFANPFDAVAGLRIDLPAGSELPLWSLVRRRYPVPAPVDIETRVIAGIGDLAAQLPEGLTGRRIAVATGSRGIADIARVVRATVEALRTHGAEPFLVPAMGSHGSADASGQAQVLADLGMSQETLGIPVRATMGTVVVGTTSDGMPVHLDQHAAGADGIILVNRVKPHTDFAGDFGSGLAKMSAIGLGNAVGAAVVHSAGSAALPRRIRESARILREAGHLLGGVAIVEDTSAATAHVEVVPASGIAGKAEQALLARATELHGHLPFEQIDVLVIDNMGKNISGCGMDSNVLGRFWVPGVDEPAGPTIDVVTVHHLTEPSHGNASGVGLADLVPFRLVESVDLEASYLNAITSGTGGLRRSRLPMTLPTDRDVIHGAVRMCAEPVAQHVRLVRIRSTLHTDEMLVSSPLLPDVLKDPALEVIGEPMAVQFGADGGLPPW